MPRAANATEPILRQLATCRWVHGPHNVLITGMTGTGKSYLACALAQPACRRGSRALYRRVPRLYEELALAHADGGYIRLLARFARVDVLVLDDFARGPLPEHGCRDLLEILEDRRGERSTVITSQLPPAKWHDYVADPTLADALCDRLLHPAHRIAPKGPSRRKEAAPDS
jgi:DNA replication protein DnaC